MKNILIYTLVFVLFILLILVRYYEGLFYDPLLYYFKNNYFGKPLPEYDKLKLFINLFLRFCINSLISLAIIYLLFKDKKILKLVIKIYFFVFIIFSIIYFFMLDNNSFFGFTTIFYIRRVLIQPILLLLLIPIIYFYISHKKNKN